MPIRRTHVIEEPYVRDTHTYAHRTHWPKRVNVWKIEVEIKTEKSLHYAYITNIHDCMHITVKRPKVIAHTTPTQSLFFVFFLVKKTTPTITNVNCLFFCAPRRDDKNGKIRYGYAATKPISIRTSIIYHFICLLTSFNSLRCLHFHHKHSTTTIERDSKQTNKNNLIKRTTFNVKWNWTNTLLSARKLHVKSSSTDLKQNEEGGEVVVVIVVVTIKN